MKRRNFLSFIGLGAPAVLVGIKAEPIAAAVPVETIVPANNTVLTAQMVAREALRVLDNNLVFVSDVESEFIQSINGYKLGSTLRIRLPANFTVQTKKPRIAHG